MSDQMRFYESKLNYEIDSADLDKALKAGERLVVVDARSREAYELEHIPGAISFPHKTMNHESTRALDRGVLYVTYCDGIGCNASTKGALNLAKIGFRVKELIGGIDWWKRDAYPTHGKHAQSAAQVECGCDA